MDMFDVVKAGLGGLSGSGGGNQAAMLNAVMALLGGGGGAQGGGLGALVQAFEGQGLGNLVNSWVSTGQNLPISPDQLSQVLGGDTLSRMSGQLGMNQGDLLGQLSHMLPQVVDRLTPHGQIPQGDIHGMGDQLGGLLSGLLGAGSR